MQMFQLIARCESLQRLTLLGLLLCSISLVLPARAQATPDNPSQMPADDTALSASPQSDPALPYPGSLADDLNEVTREVPGVFVCYYSGTEFNTQQFCRIHDTISFSYAQGPGYPLSANGFSGRFEGRLIAPMTGDVRLCAFVDDGLRLFINNINLINEWQRQVQEHCVTYPMIEGQQYPFLLEYMEIDGSQALHFRWSYAGQSRIDIPASAFLLPADLTKNLALRQPVVNWRDVTREVETVTDGHTYNPGQWWDTSPMAWFTQTGAFLVIDLGQRTNLNLIRVFADHNETYDMAISDDNVTFDVIGSVPVVGSMQMQWREIAVDAQGRYLRFTLTGGDGFASIGEVEVFGDFAAAAPSAPTNFNAVLASDTQIDLTWTDTADTETHFVLERHNGTGDFQVVADDIAANSSSYSDTNLTCDTVYTYRLTAVNGNVASAPAEVSATTDRCMPLDAVAEVVLRLNELDSTPGLVVAESFEIIAECHDVRDRDAEPMPVFSCYMDVSFAPEFVRVDGISYNNVYGFQQTGSIGAGLVDEVGAVGPVAQGNTLEVFRLQATALAEVQSTQVISGPAGDIFSEIILYGQVGDKRQQTDFGDLALTIGADSAQTPCEWADFDGSGDVGFGDVLMLIPHYDTVVGDPDYDQRYDYDNSEEIDFGDVLILVSAYGQTCE